MLTPEGIMEYIALREKKGGGNYFNGYLYAEERFLKWVFVVMFSRWYLFEIIKYCKFIGMILFNVTSCWELNKKSIVQWTRHISNIH